MANRAPAELDVLKPLLGTPEEIEMDCINFFLQSPQLHLRRSIAITAGICITKAIEDYDRMIRIILLTTIPCTHLDIVHSSQYV